jgi:hypothetical protein
MRIHEEIQISISPANNAVNRGVKSPAVQIFDRLAGLVAEGRMGDRHCAIA